MVSGSYDKTVHAREHANGSWKTRAIIRQNEIVAKVAIGEDKKRFVSTCTDMTVNIHELSG